MCYWYYHLYKCKHTAYAPGKYCEQGNLVQTPCKKKNIWQTIRIEDKCEECEAHGEGGDTPSAVEREAKAVRRKGSARAGRRK